MTASSFGIFVCVCVWGGNLRALHVVNCSHMVHSQANTHSFIRWVWVNVTLPRLSGWWAVELPPSCYDLSDCSFKFPRFNHLLMFVHFSLFVLVGVYSTATLAGRCWSKQWRVCVDCQQGGLSLAAIRGDSTGRDRGIPLGSRLETLPWSVLDEFLSVPAAVYLICSCQPTDLIIIWILFF